jgi:penicillin-insensitive murein DD-endopeptidase
MKYIYVLTLAITTTVASIFSLSPTFAQSQTAGLEKPAKELFGAKHEPAPLEARSIGSYARGCLAGANALPVDGETWQVMRLSRNRNWGHPTLIQFLEKFSRDVTKVSAWNGLMVGDLAQPRGGPMLTGHASHQIGLDADIWLTPMPERRLSREERETISAINVVSSDWNDVDPQVWTADHRAVIKLAAQNQSVHRIFVNPAIKKALCREAGKDRAWLSKVRPMYGHNYHFHVRMECPSSSDECQEQDTPPQGDGCGKDLDWWFTDEARNPKPSPPRPPMSLSALPQSCKEVLLAK